MPRSETEVTVFGGDATGMAEKILDVYIRPSAEDAVERGAQLIAERMRALVSRPYAGTAAAKGEPPRQREGQLADSIDSGPAEWKERTGRRERPSKWSVRAPFGSDLPQAGRLEFGGTDKRGRRILPHPYLRTAVAESRARVDRILESV